MFSSRWLPFAFLVALASSFQAAAAPDAPAADPAILDGLSPEAAMVQANIWARATPPSGVVSTVTGREIRFQFPGGETRTVALPEDRMVVAIAPYIGKTHACRDHVMSSCQGEQTDVEVRVRAVAQDGRTLVDTKARTLPNGFVEVWLPRGLQVEVTIEALGLKASGTVSTMEGAQTCLTTYQLALP